MRVSAVVLFAEADQIEQLAHLALELVAGELAMEDERLADDLPDPL